MVALSTNLKKTHLAILLVAIGCGQNLHGDEGSPGGIFGGLSTKLTGVFDKISDQADKITPDLGGLKKILSGPTGGYLLTSVLTSEKLGVLRPDKLLLKPVPGAVKRALVFVGRDEKTVDHFVNIVTGRLVREAALAEHATILETLKTGKAWRKALATAAVARLISPLVYCASKGVATVENAMQPLVQGNENFRAAAQVVSERLQFYANLACGNEDCKGLCDQCVAKKQMIGEVLVGMVSHYIHKNDQAPPA